MHHRPSNKPQYFFLVSMKNGCMGIIFYEFIFRIVGKFFSCQYKLGALVSRRGKKTTSAMARWHWLVWHPCDCYFPSCLSCRWIRKIAIVVTKTLHNMHSRMIGCHFEYSDIHFVIVAVATYM